MNEVIAYTFRTISVTENGWISQAQTTMADDTLEEVAVARAENLDTLYGLIATAPPRMFTLSSTWRPPYDDMPVKIQETLIKQDLMSGKAISEWEMEPYTIPYQYMGPA